MKKVIGYFVFVTVCALMASCGKDDAASERKSTAMSKKSEKGATGENGNPRVKLKTSKGDIVIELFEKEAPISTKNFLEYVKSGFYDGTIFHRVIPNFMIQCGGFTKGMKEKESGEPIKNEAKNGLKNERGTLAMARTQVVDSATSQFFINLKDNDFLNHGERDFGYAVFGKVVKGMNVVDKIGKVKTTNKGMHGDVPSEDVVIEKAEVMK